MFPFVFFCFDARPLGLFASFMIVSRVEILFVSHGKLKDRGSKRSERCGLQSSSCSLLVIERLQLKECDGSDIHAFPEALSAATRICKSARPDR